MKSLLNVGGGSKSIPIPPYYTHWRHDLLDIDPAGNPDILLDARNLLSLPPAQYDAIYCSDNLEHYSAQDGSKVIQGFKHVLKDDGFVEVRVPDLIATMKHVVQNNLDLDDILYNAATGPILVRDVLYGYHIEIQRSGSDFYAHKNGFSPKALVNFFKPHAFRFCLLTSHAKFALTGYFFKSLPTPDHQTLLEFTYPPPAAG